jgi:hypothetical protein
MSHEAWGARAIIGQVVCTAGGAAVVAQAGGIERAAWRWVAGWPGAGWRATHVRRCGCWSERLSCSPRWGAAEACSAWGRGGWLPPSALLRPSPAGMHRQREPAARSQACSRKCTLAWHLHLNRYPHHLAADESIRHMHMHMRRHRHFQVVQQCKRGCDPICPACAAPPASRSPACRRSWWW